MKNAADALPTTPTTTLPCARCKGSGTYTWGGTINGRPVHSGECFRCGGTGRDPGRQLGQEQFVQRNSLSFA